MTIDDLARLIAAPAIEYRPELRWWLAEGLHTDETLRHEIETAHRMGFGGMEFLAMDEGAIDHARYGWGSEEWVHDSQIVVEETTRRGMSVSFTSGTNWSNANLPSIDADHPAAAKELDVVDRGSARRRLPPRRASAHRPRRGARGRRPSRPPRCGARAAPRRRRGRPHLGRRRARCRLGARPHRLGARRGARLDGSRGRVEALQLLDARDRPDRVALCDRQLHRELRRPRRGARGDRLLGLGGADPRAPRADRANPRAQMYMDSLELSTYGAGGLFWGRTVAEEFRARRGLRHRPVAAVPHCARCR